MTFSLALAAVAALALGAAPAKPYKPTDDELRQIRVKTDELASALRNLAAKHVDDATLADVAVYHKAAVWIVRYADEEFFAKRYVADTLAALDRGLARAAELAAGRPTWPVQKGQLVRGYRSRVDGSVQPYGLDIPDNYDATKPVRLDVVLHGRGATLNEVSFIAAHDSPKPAPPELDYIRLDVYGRGNNAYRWSGETDVFEAIESVEKRYKIDRQRIVLRGFSMGGAGAWHLGLHYPDKWAAVEAGAGFTETKRYAKLDALPGYQDATLHIYDAADYAVNIGNVPFVGYAGEEDGQLQANVNIRAQLVQEGFPFTQEGLNWTAKDLAAVFLVGPKTGHKFHPESKQQSDAFIQAALAKGSRAPNHVRFVTYTTRYNQCHWITVAALEKHYERAEVDARRSDDGMRLDITTRNVARLVLPSLPRGAKLTIDRTPVELQPETPYRTPNLGLEKDTSGRWKVRDAAKSAGPTAPGKRRGLQGPIDDAFAESFLCVRPTGRPNHALPNDYALAVLDGFVKEFSKWLRGDVRVKDDTAVTPGDIENHNLILFGDPGSNKLLGQIAGRLPMRWTKDAIAVGGKKYLAADHALVMIYPNPLNPSRYVVLNSGHTFHEKEFRGTNALLFPRLGDYAVLRVAKTAAGLEATPETAGLFDEHWLLKPFSESHP